VQSQRKAKRARGELVSHPSLVHQPPAAAHDRFTALVALALLGAAVVVYRFANGPPRSPTSTTAILGIWIAIDVVVGTAPGCGGYRRAAGLRSQ
jgi:hypothetical protein